ncbi:MAG: metallophosphoesterase [Oscillospiraceae bacterium]|nr:metallophosphoesterase [Oscillospiraceae bacterium]
MNWLKRRRVLQIVVSILLLYLFFFYYQNNVIMVTKIDMTSGKTNGVRIVHLSDLHDKQFGRDNKRLLKKVSSLEPDIIVVTGDTLDNPDKMEQDAEFVIALLDYAPVFCIAGNHEWLSGKRHELAEILKDNGIIFLEDEIYTLSINDSTINILGLDERLKTKRIPDLFEELETMQGLNIVLSHYPENYSLTGEKSYNQYEFDIMFSGHSHGGQFILPFVGGVYSPGQGLFPRYYRGLYDGRLIVSAGLGDSVFPQRLFNRPQVIVVMQN